MKFLSYGQYYSFCKNFINGYQKQTYAVMKNKKGSKARSSWCIPAIEDQLSTDINRSKMDYYNMHKSKKEINLFLCIA